MPRPGSPAFLLACLLAAPAVAAEDAPGARGRRDVPYSEAGPTTTLNVDAPAEGDGHPVVVWIHGGAWRFGDKDNARGQRAAFNREGYAWVAVEYRFVPDVTYREQAGDVAKAVRWARDHAKEFGGDPSKIFLMGHSAGAHLAALVATDERYLGEAGLKLADLSGVVLLDGAGYDVRRQVGGSVLPRVRAMYTGVFGTDPKVQEDASPVAHVAAEKGIPPFLILHVGRVDSREQSKALAGRLRDAGVEATVAAFPAKNHATINREMGRPGDGPTEAVFKFLAARRGPEAGPEAAPGQSRQAEGGPRRPGETAHE